MARLLAIEWNQSEVRYVLANTQGENVRVALAESIPLEHSSDEADSLETRVSATIKAALAERKVGRVSTLIAVGRSSVELFEFTLPPAEDAELPELVANMAARESPGMTDDCVLDFVATNDNSAESRSVIAMVLPADEVSRISVTCEAAGLTPYRIVPRSYSIASLFQRPDGPHDRNTLLVNLVDEEADLTVVAGGRVVFSRTVRLPHRRDEPPDAERLIAEIRRTLLVAPKGPSGEADVQAISVFGRPGDHGALIGRIQDEIELPAEEFNVFGAVDVPADVAPADAGCFASLVGLLVEEARGGSPAIDFLHPKKPPKPPDRKRRLLLAAAGVAGVMFLGAYYVWHTLASADAEIAVLSNDLKELKETVKHADKKRRAYRSVRSWNAAQVVWLDELRDLSLRFPSVRDVMLLDLAISPSRSGGGTVRFHGLARDPMVVTRMEQDLRDPFHKIRTPRVVERVQDESYTWRFESTLAVAPRNKSEYVSHLPESLTAKTQTSKKRTPKKP